MNILRQLGTNSAIYAGANLLQKGAAFLLVPLYTRLLDPAAFGIIAVVTGVTGLLGILFTFGLTSAITRFYFEYGEQPRVLAEFWGTVLIFVLILSALLTGVLLLIGATLLAPLLGGIAFWPFVALGVATAFFQPFFTTWLATLQIRNQAGRYAVMSLAYFAVSAAIAIALIVGLGMQATGPLAATLIATGVFFVISLVALRRDIKLCLRWRHLRQALAYSLPLVPHSVSGQATAFADRLILNAYLGPAVAGVYSVGAMIAMVVEVAAQSVNRAYVPISMAALKRGAPEDFAQVRALGTVCVAVFCLLAASIATFGAEFLGLFASAAFGGAAPVIPLLVFGGVANGLYCLFVNVLFFDLRAVKLIPLGTAAAALSSVGFAILLVPRAGMLGAAWAAVLAQMVAALLVAVIARRFDPVHWPYLRYAAAVLLCLGVSVLLSQWVAADLLATLACKLAGLATLAVALSAILWSRPLIIVSALARLMHRRPHEAAALFMKPRAAT